LGFFGRSFATFETGHVAKGETEETSEIVSGSVRRIT